VCDILEQWEQAAQVDFFDEINIVDNKNFSNLADYYFKDKLVNGIYLSSIQIDELPSHVLASCQVFVRAEYDEFKRPYLKIVHADIILNGYYHLFSFESQDNISYHFPSLILHEFGHFLGLGHFGSEIMSKKGQSRLEVNDLLSDIDSDEIFNLYNDYSPRASANAGYLSSEVPSGEKALMRIVINKNVDKSLSMKIVFEK
jgi:hypothetical protein